MVLYCCVGCCKRNSRDDEEYSFFRLPKDPELRAKWTRFAVGVNGELKICSRICSDHFGKRCILKTYPRVLLLKNAIPTILESKGSAAEPAEESPRACADFENSDRSSGMSLAREEEVICTRTSTSSQKVSSSIPSSSQPESRSDGRTPNLHLKGKRLLPFFSFGIPSTSRIEDEDPQGFKPQAVKTSCTKESQVF
ncbi:THAP domain-containing protein 10-like [Belonocnema kinseyi]|uniref:THAP domain-containing protein 10-like n=1 Tax=Belonocnema kinseyi TaxID=2817044 RepID=UPI00143CEBF6|nr:THAP domain-containing protein 10-like [Belonocnema kinseyi]